MDETQVPPEYDMDETYVEGYTQEEGTRAYFSANIQIAKSCTHVLYFYCTYR